jgi:hypothetical protein
MILYLVGLNREVFGSSVLSQSGIARGLSSERFLPVASAPESIREPPGTPSILSKLKPAPKGSRWAIGRPLPNAAHGVPLEDSVVCDERSYSHTCQSPKFLVNRRAKIEC